MNNENLLLYSVEANLRRSSVGDEVCINCNTPIINLARKMETRLAYYDYKKLEHNEFIISLCQKCFNKKIRDKSIKSVFPFIPLLKMKGKEIEVMRFGYNPNDELMKPYNNEGVYNEHEYVKIVSNELLLDYNQRAMEYNEANHEYE